MLMWNNLQGALDETSGRMIQIVLLSVVKLYARKNTCPCLKDLSERIPTELLPVFASGSMLWARERKTVCCVFHDQIREGNR